MKGKRDEYPTVFLQTGDCYLAVRPTLVTTVLGSCVAITMTHAKTGIGSICHAFLPDSGERHGTARDPQVCRFVDTAVANMLQGMNKLRVPLQDMTIKVFGGGSGLAVRTSEFNMYNVGHRNVEAAKRILSDWGLPIDTMDVGGNQGRKLHFLTHTGEVWLKRLAGSLPG